MYVELKLFLCKFIFCKRTTFRKLYYLFNKRWCNCNDVV